VAEFNAPRCYDERKRECGDEPGSSFHGTTFDRDAAFRSRDQRIARGPPNAAVRER
jgi:hypothetical protein